MRCRSQLFSDRRSEEHTSELQSLTNLVCRLLLEKKQWKALERAQAAALVRSLPKHLETVVGERAYRLSGGQKSRLATARFLLKCRCFVNHPETTEIYTLALHDALPI